MRLFSDCPGRMGHQHDRRRPPGRGVGGAKSPPQAVPRLRHRRGGQATPPELRDAEAFVIASTLLGLHQGEDVSRSVPFAGFFGTPDRCPARAAGGELGPRESKALGGAG
jgi:hypothetical protein